MEVRKQIFHLSLITFFSYLCSRFSKISLLPRWWNGRHEGLKIPWLLQLCGFESRSRHEKRDRVYLPRFFVFISLDFVEFLQCRETYTIDRGFIGFGLFFPSNLHVPWAEIKKMRLKL